VDGHPEPPERRTLTPAVIAATLFVAACATFAVSFVAARGGLTLPVAASRPPVAIASPEASEAPAPTETALPVATTQPTAEATETPAPTVPATEPPPSQPPAFALPAIKASDPLRSLEQCPDHPVCFEYVVQRNDTMNRILGRYNLDLDVVLALNPQLSDPSLIVVNHTLYLGRDRFARLDLCPNGERCLLYKVVKGDSLKDIAARYAITTDSIRGANPALPNPITPGLVLKLPYPG
jgi:hypothetical protein